MLLEQALQGSETTLCLVTDSVQNKNKIASFVLWMILKNIYISLSLFNHFSKMKTKLKLHCYLF
jgi:hypothetical protein